MSPAAPVARLAVLDVGSNSTRLFLCSGLAADGPVGERLATVTALRRGASASGRLATEALARLDAALADLGARAGAFEAQRVVAVGTSAVREAPNREAVEALVCRHLGAPLTVIAGEEEARLAFAGARLALAGGDGAHDVLVIDVGGGSSELVRGGAGGPEGVVSLPLGAVRGTDAHLASDPPAADEVDALRAQVAGAMPAALARIGGPAPAVGVAGTATSLAAVDLGRYDPARVHRRRLTAAGVEELLDRLAALPLARRREVPGLDPARAPAIVAGAAIVAQILQSAGLDGLLVSERDLLDGIALAVHAGEPIAAV